MSQQAAIMSPALGTTPPWRLILRWIRPQWRGYALMWLLTIASSAVILLQPWPAQILVDHVLGDRPAPAWLGAVLAALPLADSPLSIAAWIAVAALMMFAVQSAVDVALTMSWLRVAQRGVYRLAGDVFARLQRRSPVYHAITPVGDSVRRITGDSWCIYNGVGALVFTPLHALLVGTVMVAILLSMNPFLTVLALAAAPLLAATSIILGRHAERAKGAEREIQGAIESHLQQSLAGMRIVQTSVQEGREHGRFVSLAGSAVLAHRRSAAVAALSGGSAGLVTALGTGAVLGIGALEVLAGRLTVGQLIVFLAYLATLNGQLVRVATGYTMLRGLAPSVRRIAEVLDAAPEMQDEVASVAAAADAASSRGPAFAIQFDRVCFEYTPGCPVLRDVSLEIPPGAMLAIVGPSGSGKSTLAALLPRLMDPTAGRILIGGRDVRTMPLAELRRQIAVAFQDPMLFADTLAANIALGRPEAPREEIERAGAAAGLAGVASDLPQGYDTLLGEGGKTLSGGQQQRVAIARALLMNAPVLVLDEPSSALDARTEAQLFEMLRATPREARPTTILIAHRLSTVRAADIIAVLEKGAIVETGTHDELVQRAGMYARLWSMQSGEPAAAAVRQPVEAMP